MNLNKNIVTSFTKEALNSADKKLMKTYLTKGTAFHDDPEGIRKFLQMHGYSGEALERTDKDLRRYMMGKARGQDTKDLRSPEFLNQVRQRISEFGDNRVSVDDSQSVLDQKLKNMAEDRQRIEDSNKRISELVSLKRERKSRVPGSEDAHRVQAHAKRLQKKNKGMALTPEKKRDLLDTILRAKGQHPHQKMTDKSLGLTEDFYRNPQGELVPRSKLGRRVLKTVNAANKDNPDIVQRLELSGGLRKAKGAGKNIEDAVGGFNRLMEEGSDSLDRIDKHNAAAMDARIKRSKAETKGDAPPPLGKGVIESAEKAPSSPPLGKGVTEAAEKAPSSAPPLGKGVAGGSTPRSSGATASKTVSSSGLGKGTAIQKAAPISNKALLAGLGGTALGVAGLYGIHRALKSDDSTRK